MNPRVQEATKYKRDLLLVGDIIKSGNVVRQFKLNFNLFPWWGGQRWPEDEKKYSETFGSRDRELRNLLALKAAHSAGISIWVS